MLNEKMAFNQAKKIVRAIKKHREISINLEGKPLHAAEYEAASQAIDEIESAKKNFNFGKVSSIEDRNKEMDAVYKDKLNIEKRKRTRELIDQVSAKLAEINKAKQENTPDALDKLSKLESELEELFKKQKDIAYLR